MQGWFDEKSRQAGAARLYFESNSKNPRTVG